MGSKLNITYIRFVEVQPNSHELEGDNNDIFRPSTLLQMASEIPMKTYIYKL